MTLTEQQGTSSPPAPIPQLLVNAVETVILGKRRQVELAVAALLAGSHLMLEDEPGVGKTVLANALSGLMSGRFARIQGSPDLLPSDIVGVNTFNPETRAWEFHHGPIFTNVLLFDELNRSTPRSQSALLEAMAERQTTVDGKTYRLPNPFVVVATQNPMDHAGTFALVEGQRDRFDVAISLGLPSRDVERSLLQGSGGRSAVDAIQPIVATDSLVELQATIAAFYVAEPVLEYALDIVAAIRETGQGRQVLSTRATQSLLAVARAMAALRNRHYVVPDDIADVAPAVLAHRARPHDALPVAAAWVDEITSTIAAPSSAD